MRLFALALLFVFIPTVVEAAPKSVVLGVSDLPPHVKVVTSKLSEGWYGFSVQVDLKQSNVSPIDSWSAEIVLKKENENRHYLLSAQLIPSPVFRGKNGQLLSASSQKAELETFYTTVHLDLLKEAWIHLRDDENMIIYEVKLWTSPGLPK